MWKWVKGRQKTRGYGKYYKLKLWEWLGTDCYLIKYDPHCFLPMHKDIVEGRKHYRMNLVLKGDSLFYIDEHIFKWWRIVLFRPDLYPHCVRVSKTGRMVLSVGFTIKNNS
jgi:hypothetical protein